MQKKSAVEGGKVKRAFLVIFLIMMVTSWLAAETKFKMELWNRWTYARADGETIQNEMALKRGYFRLEPKFGQNISGRFNLDFFSDDGPDDGAGIKLKYAYLDFVNLIPIRGSKLTAGLMKTYFGTIYDWDYTTIDKDPSDKYKFVSSTDYGVGIFGYVPNGLGSYAVNLYNGEGYKKTGSDINKDMNINANLRLTPIPGVTVGGSYMMQTKNDDEIDGEKNPDRQENTLIAGMSKLVYGHASLLTQYLMKTVSLPNVDDAEDVTTSVISLMPAYKLNNIFDVVARYDIYDPDTDTDDDGESTFIGGVNYHIMRDAKNAPKLLVQANYQITSYEDAKDDESELMVQLRWIFSETFK